MQGVTHVSYSFSPGTVVKVAGIDQKIPAAKEAFDLLCDFLETSCDQNVYTLQQLHDQIAFLAPSADNIYSTYSL
jgi:hypothetical protein